MKLETIIKYIDSECLKKSSNLEDVALFLDNKCKSLIINLERSSNNIYGLKTVQDVVDIKPSKVFNMPDNNVKWFCFFIKYSQYRLSSIKEINDKWTHLNLSDDKKYKLLLLKEKIKFG